MYVQYSRVHIPQCNPHPDTFTQSPGPRDFIHHPHPAPLLPGAALSLMQGRLCISMYVGNGAARHFSTRRRLSVSQTRVRVRVQVQTRVTDGWVASPLLGLRGRRSVRLYGGDVYACVLVCLCVACG